MATQRLGPPWLGGALLVLGLAVFVAAAFAQAPLALCLSALALSIAGFTRCALAHLRRPASTTTPSRRALMLLLTCAAAARLLCAASPPVLSDDLYRYVWDGRVQAAGINPYLHAPAAGALHALRDTQIHPRVNHPDVRTIYPPLAELFFAAARGPFDSPTGFKLLLAMVDLATCALLWRMLARRGRAHLTALYAYNPLVLVELSSSGHMDALLLFFLVLALERADAGRARWAAIALAAAVATKLFAVVLLPFFARRARVAWALVPALVALVYVPYLGAGERLFSGLGAYAGAWRFNETTFAALDEAARIVLPERAYDLGTLGRPRGRDAHAEWALHAAGAEAEDTGAVVALLERAWVQGDTALRETLERRVADGGTTVMSDALAHALAQGAALLLWGLCVLACWWRRVPLEVATLWTLGALLLLSATVQPWYATWLVPLALLVLARDTSTRERLARATAVAALTFSATVCLSYVVLLREPSAPWQVPALWRTLEYGVPALVGALAWLRMRNEDRHAKDTATP